MDNYKFEKICKNIVKDYFNNNAEKTDNKKINIQDIFIVSLLTNPHFKIFGFVILYANF